MNNLNSILIEGVASYVEEVMQGNTFSFNIESHRYTKDKKTEVVTVHKVDVPIVCNGTLALVAKANITKGRGVRVVGRIDAYGSIAGLCVWAEHIEFRPENKELAKETE